MCCNPSKMEIKIWNFGFKLYLCWDKIPPVVFCQLEKSGNSGHPSVHCYAFTGCLHGRLKSQEQGKSALNAGTVGTPQFVRNRQVAYPFREEVYLLWKVHWKMKAWCSIFGTVHATIHPGNITNPAHRDKPQNCWSIFSTTTKKVNRSWLPLRGDSYCSCGSSKADRQKLVGSSEAASWQVRVMWRSFGHAVIIAKAANSSANGRSKSANCEI